MIQHPWIRAKIKKKVTHTQNKQKNSKKKVKPYLSSSIFLIYNATQKRHPSGRVIRAGEEKATGDPIPPHRGAHPPSELIFQAAVTRGSSASAKIFQSGIIDRPRIISPTLRLNQLRRGKKRHSTAASLSLFLSPPKSALPRRLQPNDPIRRHDISRLT